MFRIVILKLPNVHHAQHLAFTVISVQDIRILCTEVVEPQYGRMVVQWNRHPHREVGRPKNGNVILCHMAVTEKSVDVNRA